MKLENHLKTKSEADYKEWNENEPMIFSFYQTLINDLFWFSFPRHFFSKTRTWRNLSYFTKKKLWNQKVLERKRNQDLQFDEKSRISVKTCEKDCSYSATLKRSNVLQYRTNRVFVWCGRGIL